MSSTTPREPEESHLYPLHVSDRADELIGELDEALCQPLFDALGTMSSEDWFEWMADERAAIDEYDGLAASQRRRRLHAHAGSVDAARLHHACVFLALWRARLLRRGVLPPSSPPLTRAEDQRRMLLAALETSRHFDVRDLWPFEWPQTEGPWEPPFWDFRDSPDQA